MIRMCCLTPDGNGRARTRSLPAVVVSERRVNAFGYVGPEIPPRSHAGQGLREPV